MRSLHLLLAVGFVAAFLAPVALGGDSPSSAPPRYKLEVGRKLTYSATSESKPVNEGGTGFNSKGTWQLTVVRKNPDGSRRVILRSSSTYASTSPDQPARWSPERVQIAYADVFPNGRVLENPSLGMNLDPASILPRLPEDAAEMSNPDGWTTTDDTRLETTTFTARPTTGDTFIFTAESGGPLQKIYETTHTRTFHFERGQGIVTRIHSETSQTYGFQSRGTGETTLTADEELAPGEVAKLAGEFESYLDAQKRYSELMALTKEDPSAPDKAKALLEAAQARATTEDVKEALGNILKSHERYAKEEADGFKEVLNKPSPEWSTTDIEGKPVSLADLKGKVVVMDFWYRGCGWCMYAMPQVKQLAEDYKDKPVVVLGMNTDQDKADAKVVIDAFGLQHPTVRAQGISEKYGIRGFPTLVIVDQDGVVRDVHVGYSPTLRADVGKRIDELLAGPAARAGG